jgi:hypothetical protein
MTTKSEKPPKPQRTKKVKKSKHKGLPMSLKVHRNPVESQNESSPPTRAVYINTRTCLQTFKGYCIRYMNIPVRLAEGYIPLCHWGVLCSTELPPEELKSGQKCTLIQSWKMTSSTYELEIPSLGERQASIHMGSCEERFPAAQRRSKHMIYLGTTTLSDAELQEVGELVLEYLQVAEKGYHGLYRNCQHFVVFLASIVCPDAKIPKTADSLCGGLFRLFKRKNTNMKKRIENAKDFYLAERKDSTPEKKDLQEKGSE